MISWSKSGKQEQEVVYSVSSGLGVAQVFLPRRHLFSGHTVGEESGGLSVRERGNDHDFVAGLKREAGSSLDYRLRGSLQFDSHGSWVNVAVFFRVLSKNETLKLFVRRFLNNLL